MTFSVIIPAYNSESYIRKLLDSIRSQTFTDYEIIVVCDKCTDNTKQVAKEYGAITDNVSFGRDGLTRDRGIELASGAWILFADDDDWFYSPSAFQELADFIAQQPANTDVIGFGYENRTKGYVKPSYFTIFAPRLGHVWSACWKHSSIQHARFGDAVFCSDTYFIRDVKRNGANFKLLDKPIYYYNFLRPGSQTDLFCQGKIKESPIAK